MLVSLNTYTNGKPTKGKTMIASAVLTLAMCSSPALDVDLQVKGGDLFATFKVGKSVVYQSSVDGRVKDGVWSLKCPNRRCSIDMILSANYADIKLKARDLKLDVESECLQAID